MAKNFLKERNIEFEDIDVGNDADAAKEMIEKSGQMGVPVIDIDGEIIVGFDKVAMMKVLRNLQWPFDYSAEDRRTR